MPSPSNTQDDNEPPSPQEVQDFQKIQSKMRRLLWISVLVMFGGFLTVALAIFYKLNTRDAAPSAPLPSSIHLDAEERVQSVHFYQEYMILLVDTNGRKTLVAIHPSTGSIAGRTRFIHH